MVKKSIAAFVIFQLVFPQALFAGNSSEPLNTKQPPVPVTSVNLKQTAVPPQQGILSETRGEDPVKFVNDIATKLYTSFDVNGDKILDLKDLDQIDKAKQKFSEIGAAQFSVSTQKVFKNWTDYTSYLKKYLKAFTPVAKLNLLDGLWQDREWFLNPVLKNSISSFLVDETLKVSLKAGAGTPGYQPIYNLSLAMFVRIAKRENRKDWLDNFRTHYLVRSMKKFSGETASQYEQRKKLVFEIWDKYQVLVYHSLKSFPSGATSADFSSHNLYLKQIKNLIEGMATPYIQKFLDVVSINPSNNRGDGFFAGVVMIKPLGDPGTFVHEFTHLTTHQLGFLNQVPPGYGTLFVESAPEDLISGYVGVGQAGYEDLAELGRVVAEDTLKFLTDALTKAVAGKSVLLEKFLSLYAIFPQDPGHLTSYKIDPKTGQVTRGKIPIKRDGKDRITELTLNNQTYHLDYDPVTARLKKVTV